MKPTAIVAIGAAVLIAAFFISQRIPTAPSVDVKAIQADLAASREREAAAVAREKVWRDSAARAHNAGARSGAEFERRRIAIAKAPLVVITDTAAVRQALAQRDSALYVAQQAIADRDRELAARDSADRDRDAADAAKEQRAQALERLNASIAAQIPTRRQQMVHDAKVVGFTLAAVGTAQLVFGRH